VRKNGSRDGGDIIVPLVPITERISYEDAQGKKQAYLRKHAFMYYSYPDSNDVAVLGFAKAHWINIDVLDLAVLDKEGICRLDFTKDITIPPNLTAGWKIRANNVIKKFADHRNHLEKLKVDIDTMENGNSKKNLWQAVMPKMSLTSCGLPPEPYLGGIFDFGLRRIGRYRQPGASKLLKAYTQYLSRDADEPDFARPIALPHANEVRTPPDEA
jgi:hypothetical protein